MVQVKPFQKILEDWKKIPPGSIIELYLMPGKNAEEKGPLSADTASVVGKLWFRGGRLKDLAYMLCPGNPYINLDENLSEKIEEFCVNISNGNYLGTKIINYQILKKVH